MRYELNFEAEPFNDSWYFNNEFEAKIALDERGWDHILYDHFKGGEKKPRFPNPEDQAKIIDFIERSLLGKPAPADAVGGYEWYVRLDGLNQAPGWAYIVATGFMIRTVLTGNMVPRGDQYRLQRIRGGGRVLAKVR